METHLSAAMAECLGSLTGSNKVLCWKIGATRHWMTLDKSLTAVGLGSLGRTLRQAGLLSRATASNSCRENIGLLQLSSDSAYIAKYPKGQAFFLFSFLIYQCQCLSASIILIEISFPYVWSFNWIDENINRNIY
jgi:hypothetical protein